MKLFQIPGSPNYFITKNGEVYTMTFPTTTQFRAVTTPSGKKAFEAYCAVLKGKNGDEAAVCTPTLEALKIVWLGVAGTELDASRAQHVYIVSADQSLKDALKEK